MSVEQSRRAFAALGNEQAATFGKGGRHPRMHRTETIDYAIVLSGEITMLLDDEDVVLKAGDILVQCGTNHAWSNRSNAPAVVAFILIDGEFEPGLKERFGDATLRSCRVPDEVQREAMHRRSGTRLLRSEQPGSRVCSASLRAALRPGHEISAHQSV